MAPGSRSAPRRTPSTDRGRAMHRALLQAAEKALAAGGYHGTSVAGVCQAAGVSNAAFYQYFPDKEALFLELWGNLQALLLADLRRAVRRGFGLKGRVEAAAVALSELLVREGALFQVFREAEFVASATSQAFYRQLEAELPALLDAPSIDPAALTYFVLGAVYFNLVARAVWQVELSPLPTILDLLLHGMAPPGASPRLWQELPDLPAPPEEISERLPAASASSGSPATPGERRPVSRRGERTRARLLDAAGELFGTLGYHDCGTSKVAEAAGVAHGTLFRYFPTKLSLLTELVTRTRRRLQAAMASCTAGLEHRLQVEAQALRAFLRFIQRHPEAYRIVREAEFVERSIGAGYYLDLAERYRAALVPAMQLGQVRGMDPLALGLAIMGVGHYLGLRWPVWEQRGVPEATQRQVFDLMMVGVLGVVEGAGGAGG